MEDILFITLYGCKNVGSMDDVEDSEELDGCVEVEEYGGCLVKARKAIVIEDDDQTQCEMSEEEALAVWHRLKQLLDWLFISFRRLKEYLAETGNEIHEAIVSPDAIVVMNSTSMNLKLYNCFTNLLADCLRLYDNFENI